MENIENVIFELIVHSGNARGFLYEALDQTEKKDYAAADQSMKEAEQEMVTAHNVQTKLIQDDLTTKDSISLLLIHAQDQFMTTMSEQSLIERLIKMQKQINELS